METRRVGRCSRDATAPPRGQKETLALCLRSHFYAWLSLNLHFQSVHFVLCGTAPALLKRFKKVTRLSNVHEYFSVFWNSLNLLMSNVVYFRSLTRMLSRSIHPLHSADWRSDILKKKKKNTFSVGALLSHREHCCLNASQSRHGHHTTSPRQTFA